MRFSSIFFPCAIFSYLSPCAIFACAIITVPFLPKFLSNIPSDKQVNIKNIYMDLTRTELLERCLKGRTQNLNESLHSKLWAKCSKTKYSGPNRVRFAASVTVMDHNFGYLDASLLTHLGFGASRNTLAGLNIQETKRKTPPSKKTKKQRPRKETQHYQAGGF